jgi:hypothetical protein
MYVCMYVCMYVYNISGGVAHIFYQNCAQIDNNQQVYEAQIQVPRCNSILMTGSHKCQKLRPLHLDRCTGEHTDHTIKATHLNVCILSSVWARSCFWIGVSTPHQIFPHPLFLFILYLLLLSPFLLLYFQRLHKSDNDQITYLGFTFVLKRNNYPFTFFVIMFQVGNKS